MSDIDAAIKAAEDAEAATSEPEGTAGSKAIEQPPEATPDDPTQVAADESIYVVQHRVYSKSGKLELTPLFYTSLNNKFVGHFGIGFAAAYHLRENLSIEFQTTVPFVIKQFYSALVFEVYDHESLTPEVVDLKQMDYFGALSVQFSALYGKMEFYGWLIDYDFYATAGFGLVSTLETCPPNRDGCGDDLGIGRGLRSPDGAGDRFKLSGNLGGGMRFFFSDHVGLRLEIRDVVFSDKAEDAGVVTSDIRNNVLFIAGLTFLL
ncbi:outer membrane beta-barrel domain-containing protein [Myxococcota bacterium]